VARVLVCVPGVPHRSRGASSVLFYHYIDQLLRAGHQVLCLLLLEGGEDVSAFQEENRFQLVTAKVSPLLRFGKYSGRAIAGELPQDVIDKAKAFDARFVLYFDLGAAAVAKALGEGRKRIAWLGDLAFHSIWHHALYDAKEDPRALLGLPKIWLFCRRWRAAYRRFLQGVDLVVVSSKSSEAAMGALGVESVYLPYPWPIDKPFRSAAKHRAAGDKPRFLFCGTLSGLGSRSAIHQLLDSLYPELVKRWGAGGFEVLITGTRSLPEWAMESIRGKPEIRFEGFVDDLYARMDRCHAAIVPIDVPVGNRSRILTAMGYGLLVVAHPNTALGNPDLVSGKTCLLADSPAAFAECLASAHSDAAMAARIEQAARETYERLFSPAAAGGMLMDRMKALA
jgi:glycosyltransferase involved in cell wall biosynthesis